MLNIFENDAFSVVNLTDAINNLQFVPGRIGEMRLFEPEGVTTTTVAIEQKGDILVLVPPTPRGAPGITLDKEKRNIRNLNVPHFEINESIMADEVQNVRAFGTTSELETVATKVAQRQRMHANSFAATEEYARIGAIKGVVTYADGSQLNLFTEFEVAQETEIDFDLDNATPAEGALRRACAGVTRQVANLLGGAPYRGLHAFCGDDFFDDLLSHQEVRETFKGWSQAQILREGYVGPNRSSFGIFEFGDIVWENYRGSVGGSTFVNTDKCHIFPIGVPGLFRSVWAPGDWEETVNTMGRRLYSRQWPMPNGKGRTLDSQMNGLHY